MARLFYHPEIEVYSFDNLPLGQQMWLVDEKWLDDYASLGGHPKAASRGHLKTGQRSVATFKTGQ
jgi:hypothetical protein